MSNIFNVFGPSPIKPIEQHMKKVYHCTKELIPFCEAALSQDWDSALKIKKQINALERDADTIKKKLRLNLPTGLFLPVSRTDLLELLTNQDKIANKAQDIAGLMLSRKIIIPKSVTPIFMPFLERCISAAKLACKAINELDELLETGFRGSEVKIVEEMIVALDEIENDCDAKLAEIRQEIFKLETEIPVLEVIFLYKLVYWIGDLADHAQTVGGRLQILIAR